MKLKYQSLDHECFHFCIAFSKIIDYPRTHIFLLLPIKTCARKYLNKWNCSRNGTQSVDPRLSRVQRQGTAGGDVAAARSRGINPLIPPFIPVGLAAPPPNPRQSWWLDQQRQKPPSHPRLSGPIRLVIISLDHNTKKN